MAYWFKAKKEPKTQKRAEGDEWGRQVEGEVQRAIFQAAN